MQAKENSIKRKTRKYWEKWEKTANCSGNIFRVVCCILHDSSMNIPYAHSEDAAAHGGPRTCAVHMCQRIVFMSVWVWMNEGAETNAFSWNFIHKDFILLFRTQRSKRPQGVQRKSRRQGKKKGPDLFRPGHEHENKDLLPLNMDSPRPWHVCQKYAEIVVKFKLEIERERETEREKERGRKWRRNMQIVFMILRRFNRSFKIFGISFEAAK